MKLQQAYLSGFERKAFTSYGYTLHPLTLGHVQCMAELGCVIPWGGQKVTLSDVAMTVAVCAIPQWEQARDAMTTDDSYALKITTAIMDAPIEAQTSSCLEYLIYDLAKPLGKQQHDPMESRCPWWWSYAEFLQTEMHRTEKQAWGTICSDAFAYYASFSTRNGSEQFDTMREVVITEQIKAGKTVDEMLAEGVL